MSPAAAAKIATIVCSDKGGVGKSLVSSLLVEAHDKVGRPLAVVEIDHQRKLRNLMGNRVDISLPASADLQEITRNRHRAERFYNPIYEQWRRCDSLTDLGANVTTNVLAWMRLCYIPDLASEDGIHFRIVAVTSPDDQALKSAAEAINGALAVMGPGTETFVVLNEPSSGSGFDHYERHAVFQEFVSMRAARGLQLLHIPYCDSELMDYGRSKAMAPLAIFHNAASLAEEMQLGRIASNTEQKRMLAWMVSVQESLAPLFAPAPRARRPQPAETAHRDQPPAQVRPLHALRPAHERAAG